MSQSGLLNVSSGSLPPDVPLTFTEDSGVAVPAGNNLNIFGGVGIETSGAGDTVTISASAKTQVIAILTTTLSNATGAGTNIGPLIFETAVSNIGSAYDTTTGIFTAPAAGNYLICVNITYNTLLAFHTEGEILFTKTVAGPVQKTIFNPGLNGTSVSGYTPGIYTATLSGIVSLNLSEQFQINTIVRGGTDTVGIQGADFAYDTSLSIVQL